MNSDAPLGSLVERDARCIWHPFTQHASDGAPIPVVGAKDAWLELEDGRRVLDGISSWWTSLHGHGRPEFAKALAEQAERLDHVLFAGTTHEPAVRLAERVTALAPAPLNRCFYSDNGSTAVEVALKMAYQAQAQRGEGHRNLFLALEGSYHGDTFGAMAVGDPVPYFTAFTDLLFEVRRVAPRAEALDAIFEREGARLAAMIVEPRVQGAAGMRFHDDRFLVRARELTKQHGAYLIADEVMTGFGRTGRPFACQHSGIEPDLMSLAKGLTGGVMPLSATLATDEIFEAFLSSDRSQAFFHGHSFTGHPLGCAVALASLDLFEKEQTPDRLERAGRRMAASLDERLGERSLHHNLRQLGGIVAFDLGPEGSDATRYGKLAPALRARAIERGALLRPLGEVVYLLPPACTTDPELDQLCNVAVELAELADQLARPSA